METGRPLKITLAGFGEVGQAFAPALVKQGAELRVYHPRPRPAAREAAAAIGMAIDAQPQAAFGDADIILSVVPGTAALAIARAAAQSAGPHALFVDLTSASPRDIRASAALFPGDRYVDGAIMGAISIHAHATPVLLAGAAAPQVQARLAPLGFRLRSIAGGQPGDASTLKLLRSVFTKGIDALVMEFMLAAEAAGLRREVLEELADKDRSPLSELIAMNVRTHAAHAARRLHEVEAVQETLAGLNVPLILLPAVRERYRRSVEVFGEHAEVPLVPDAGSVFDVIVPWMLAAERKASDPQ